MKVMSPLEYLASFLAALHLTDRSEYSAHDYASLIMFAAKGREYVETASKVMKNLPNVDTLFLNLKPNNSIEDLEEALKAFVTPLVNPLKSKLPHRRFTIAIDITYQPYYGDKPNEWVHGYKPVKGATGCYKFIVVSIVSYSRRFILLALPIPAISKPMAWYCERLMDRLRKRGLRYIILTPKKEAYRKIMEQGEGVYLYSSTFSEGKTRTKVSFCLAVVLDYEGYDWLFATNYRLEDVKSYVHLYKRRWGIETTFRVQDEVEIKTKSRDMRVRYFLFLFEALLYNLWMFFKTGITFAGFMLTEFVTLFIDLVLKAVKEITHIEGLRLEDVQARLIKAA